MHILDFKSRLATASSSAESEFRSILFAAAKHLKGEGDLVLELEGGLKAVINGVKRFIHIAGQPIASLDQYFGVLKAVEPKVAVGPVKVEEIVKAEVAPEPPKPDLVEEVKSEVSHVEDVAHLVVDDAVEHGR